MLYCVDSSASSFSISDHVYDRTDDDGVGGEDGYVETTTDGAAHLAGSYCHLPVIVKAGQKSGNAENKGNSGWHFSE